MLEDFATRLAAIDRATLVILAASTAHVMSVQEMRARIACGE